MQRESKLPGSPFLIITAISLEMQRKQRNSFDDLPKAAFCSNSCLRYFNHIMVLFLRYQFERSLVMRVQEPRLFSFDLSEVCDSPSNRKNPSLSKSAELRTQATLLSSSSVLLSQSYTKVELMLLVKVVRMYEK